MHKNNERQSMQKMSHDLDLDFLGVGKWFPSLPPTSICEVERLAGFGSLRSTVLKPTRSVSCLQSSKTAHWVPPCSSSPVRKQITPSLPRSFKCKERLPLEGLPLIAWWARQRNWWGGGAAQAGPHLWKAYLLFLLSIFNSKGWSSHPHPTSIARSGWKGSVWAWHPVTVTGWQPTSPHLQINTLL